MNDLNLIEEDKKSLSNFIIEKIIPIIWVILFTSWIWYLIYTTIWINLWDIIKIIIWFIAWISIIWVWYKLKLKKFWDLIISVWILLLFWTLIYWSKTTDASSLLIPEMQSLIISFIFTIVISFISKNRNNSELIFLWSLLWAYLTPFFIWLNESWISSGSFNSYLIYFWAISVFMFQMAKSIDMNKYIIPNFIWILVWTTTLSVLYNAENNINFVSSIIFTQILFAIIAISSIWSIIFSSKEYKNINKSKYIWAWYILAVLFAIFNIYVLWQNQDHILWWILLLLLWISNFVWWYIIKNEKEIDKIEHVWLYIWWIISIIAWWLFIIDLNLYTSIIISFSSLIFWLLYYFQEQKEERLLAYLTLWIIWVVWSIIYNSWWNFFPILSSIPLILAYFISKKSSSEFAKNISVSIYSLWFFVFILNILSIVLEATTFALWKIDWVEFTFWIFYILPLILLLFAIFRKNNTHKLKQDILIPTITWQSIANITLIIISLIILISWKDIHYLIIPRLIIWIISHYLVLRNFKWIKSFWDWFNFNVWIIYLLIFSLINNLVITIWNNIWFQNQIWWPIAITLSILWIILSSFLIYRWSKNAKTLIVEKYIWISLFIATMIKVIFYDMSIMNMNNKVIVLTIVWWIILWLSYFIQKRWILKNEEIIKDEKQIEEKQEETEKMKTNSWKMNELIKNIDIQNIESVSFITLETNKKTTIKSKNLIKIIKYIHSKKWEQFLFQPKELTKIYETIISNYKSNIDKNDYEKITTIIKDFVEKWWEIIFNEKN